MSGDAHALGGTVLLVGLLLALTILIRAGLERTRAPALVGFLLLGFVVRLVERQLGLMPAMAGETIEVMAGIGVVLLLFRIGLESDLRGVIGQLEAAAPIWLANVPLTAVPSWAAAHYLLGLDFVASLFVAVALTATSIGVSTEVWSERDALGSANGEILLDAAELDDLSGVAFMALLFAVAPALTGAPTAAGPELWSTLGAAALEFAWKLALFVASCALFALSIEKAFTRALCHRLNSTDVTVAVTAVAIIVAAVAEWLGFSLAVGALFAGFVFSRDAPDVTEDHAQRALYDIFVPFFFIGIGFRIDPSGLLSGLSLGLWLVLLAISTKLASTVVPAWMVTDRRGALLLGISMIPRAEIAMIVMQHGSAAGHLPNRAYAGMVVVTLATCTLAPWILSSLLTRWPQVREAS